MRATAKAGRLRVKIAAAVLAAWLLGGVCTPALGDDDDGWSWWAVLVFIFRADSVPEAPKLSEAVLMHPPVAIGGSFQPPVVEDYELAVPGQANVGFDDVAAGLEPLLECEQRVLGPQLAAATMREAQRPSSGEKRARCLPCHAHACAVFLWLLR